MRVWLEADAYAYVIALELILIGVLLGLQA